MRKLRDERERTSRLNKKIDFLMLQQSHLDGMEFVRQKRLHERSRDQSEFKQNSQLWIEYPDLDRFEYSQSKPELQPFIERYKLKYNQSKPAL